MSERDPIDAAPGAADEPLLSRWSRLKAGARRRETAPAPAEAASASVTTDAGSAAPPPAPQSPLAGHPSSAAPPAEADAPAVPLPDLETLGQDSDYSAFLSPGVDAALRKRALRKLFQSPKFNVFDGLDTYRGDFTSFPALGSVVTADMRYQVERAARELAERAKAALTEDAPAPAAAATARTPDAPVAPPESLAHAPAEAGAAPRNPDDEPTERNEDDAAHGPA